MFNCYSVRSLHCKFQTYGVLKLDYCYLLLCGISNYSIKYHQSVKNYLTHISKIFLELIKLPLIKPLNISVICCPSENPCEISHHLPDTVAFACLLDEAIL